MNKHQSGVTVEKNSFIDKGDGVVTFPNGLTITDDTVQRNGTQYDIDSIDLNEYKGQLTADHKDTIETIIGKVDTAVKDGSRIVINKINYAVKESPLARLAYNLLVGGYSTDFSVETYGPSPGHDNIYRNAKVIGLSQVVVGNNKNANANEIVVNSIHQSKEDGLDTSEVEKEFLSNFGSEKEHQSKVKNNKKESNIMFKSVKNSREFAVVVKYKNSADEDTEVTLAPTQAVDVSEEQAPEVETQITEAVDPAVEEKREKDAKEAAEKAAKDNNSLVEALKELNSKFDKMEQSAFDAKAKKPEFSKDTNARNGMKDSKNEYSAMAWEDRHAKQINSAWDLLKRQDQEGAVVLNKINEVNLAALKADGVVKNSVTIADFGNFVISPELLTEIEGCRNDYTPLIAATSWKETLSTQFAWLKRSGDISMGEVEFCDDGADGNRKPISEYSASIETSNLMELAAVTPVCNAATRFMAADLLSDVAQGYRNDYDRKRAQLVIARMEQAIESNVSNSVIFDTNPSVEALVSLLEAYKKIANCTPNGTFVLNSSSHATIMAYALRAGVNGPLSQIFVNGSVPTMFGRPYIVVSDDLMPSLDSAGTVTITVEGVAVTVNHAVFYGNLSNFTGRTSGGLMYDLSTEAAYEESGVTKSAFQRNELVLRGSFFRGGAIKDSKQISGILSPGVS
jgi:HK97 family phage major capsid protein